MAERRRSSFGPVVLLGLGSAALAAVASTKPWLGTGTPGGHDASTTGVLEGQRYPVASAVSLVLLAAWGVLLVTRGAVRRAFAVVCVAGDLVLAGCVVAAHQTMRGGTSDSLATALGHRVDAGWTGWFWTTAVVCVVALVAGLLAVRLVPHWPEMGARYDAPTTPAPTDEIESDRDLWQALDEGRDPTRDP